jgi:hypothetical protein
MSKPLRAVEYRNIEHSFALYSLVDFLIISRFTKGLFETNPVLADLGNPFDCYSIVVWTRPFLLSCTAVWAQVTQLSPTTTSGTGCSRNTATVADILACTSAIYRKGVSDVYVLKLSS